MVHPITSSRAPFLDFLVAVREFFVVIAACRWQGLETRPNVSFNEDNL